jgi:hypothetical protein
MISELLGRLLLVILTLFIAFIIYGIGGWTCAYFLLKCEASRLSYRAGYDTIGYIHNYNPLRMYYKELPMTAADKELIRIIRDSSHDLVDIDNLSGIMLMKIHFKREHMREILDDRIMRRAAKTYEMYTQLFGKGKLLLPDMYGHSDRAYEGVSSMDDAVVKFNELFYFNKCR